MGSVIDYVKCPHCGSMAFNDFYYKTNEEYIWCYDCGYYYTYELIHKEGQSGYEEKELKNPYGYYHASFTQTPGEPSRANLGGSLKTKEDFDELLKGMLEKGMLENEPELESVKLSRFIDGKIVLKEVHNRKKYQRVQKLKKLNNV
jgi:hypothetical protein